jgi:ligand-binding sensor domain-containing protein
MIMKFTRFVFFSAGLSLLWFSCDRDNDDKSAIEGKVVRSVYIGTDGIKWFATDKGISSFNGETWTNYNEEDGLPPAVMHDLAQRPSSGGDLWIASDMGAVLSQLESGMLTVQSDFTTQNSDLRNDTVYAIAPDSFGYIWMGTKTGYAGLMNKTDWFVPEDEGYPIPVTNIGSSANGWNYFATTGGGVVRNKSSVDGISSASSYVIPWAGLPSDSVYTVFIETSTGYQWFGTNRGAAYHTATETKKNWTSFTTADGLIDNFILAIAGDADGNIWFGTKGGVSRLSNSTWTSFTETDGLADNTVYAIAIDHDGSVWFGTANGVSHYISGTWTTFR